jgi:spore coat polysaccharide biosynthesis predicted glycosyltransferase SpsG
MGHVYRALAIATELARHRVRIYTSESMPLGQAFFAGTPFQAHTVTNHAHFVNCVAQSSADLVLLDILDTDSGFITDLRNAAPATKIVTFEDLGSGAPLTDLLVAEFLHNPQVPAERQLNGIQNAILAPTFESMRHIPSFRAEVEHILVLFGGTDPSGLAERALAALERLGFGGQVDLVRGLGATPMRTDGRSLNLVVHSDVKHMPTLIAGADLAFTSAGRTIYELATFGVPSVCIAQNTKELTHMHATASNGVHMLGPATGADDAQIDKALASLLTDTAYRRSLREQALRAAGQRSNKRVLARILEHLGFDPFPDL